MKQWTVHTYLRRRQRWQTFKEGAWLVWCAIRGRKTQKRWGAVYTMNTNKGVVIDDGST